MTDIAENNIVAALITDIRTKLEEAVSIAKAAESCAIDGNVNRAMPILMEFEGLAMKHRTC
jgi:hypothetical protein